MPKCQHVFTKPQVPWTQDCCRFCVCDYMSDCVNQGFYGVIQYNKYMTMFPWSYQFVFTYVSPWFYVTIYYSTCNKSDSYQWYFVQGRHSTCKCIKLHSQQLTQPWLKLYSLIAKFCIIWWGSSTSAGDASSQHKHRSAEWVLWLSMTGHEKSFTSKGHSSPPRVFGY